MHSRVRLVLVAILVPLLCILTLITAAFLALSPRSYDRSGEAEAVGFNYALALVRQDYSTAYALLSAELINPPQSAAAFAADLEARRQLPLYEISPCVYRQNANVRNRRATVTLRVQYYDPCWRLDVGVTNLTFSDITLTLEQQEDGWRVINGSGFFDSRWRSDRP